MKILIVEDREENIQAATKALSNAHQLIIARNYQEGIEALKKHSPVIAIIDMHFPMNNGGAEEKLGCKFKEEVIFSMKVPIPVITMTSGKHREVPSSDIHFEIRFQQNQGAIGPHRVYTSGGDTKDRSTTWKRALGELLKDPARKLYIAALEFKLMCAAST
ncbi:MAG: response regulator [Leadbetterella sp.]|nr:response regulator [Leadbetterella sp.]